MCREFQTRCFSLPPSMYPSLLLYFLSLHLSLWTEQVISGNLSIECFKPIEHQTTQNGLTTQICTLPFMIFLWVALNHLLIANDVVDLSVSDPLCKSVYFLSHG